MRWDPQDLVEEARRLIAIPSDEDCTAILTYVTRRLPFLTWERQVVAKVAAGRRQFNLVALDPERPYVINTHVDTVPPLGMAEAFTPRLKGDRLYGRGAVDTKGLLAALIVAAETFYREHHTLPVSLALTVDEESTSAAGSTALAPRLGQGWYVLVLEPTQGRVCTREAGSLEFELRAYGEPRHAALFRQASHPIRTLMAFLQEAETTLQRAINVLLFEGGWEHYATPREARVLAEVLLEPGETWRSTERTLVALSRRAPFQGHVHYRRVDSEDPLDFGHHAGVDVLCEAYTQALGVQPTLDVMPSWTDAANFAKAGAACVVFGFGELSRAHSDQEYITVEEMHHTAQVLYNLFVILTHSPQRVRAGRKPARR